MPYADISNAALTTISVEHNTGTMNQLLFLHLFNNYISCLLIRSVKELTNIMNDIKFRNVK